MTPIAPATRMNKPPMNDPAIVAGEALIRQLLFSQLVAVSSARAVLLADVPVTVLASVPVPGEKNVIDSGSTVG
jgi:hypothetical protein